MAQSDEKDLDDDEKCEETSEKINNTKSFLSEYDRLKNTSENTPSDKDKQMKIHYKETQLTSFINSLKSDITENLESDFKSKEENLGETGSTSDNSTDMGIVASSNHENSEQTNEGIEIVNGKNKILIVAQAQSVVHASAQQLQTETNDSFQETKDDSINNEEENIPMPNDSKEKPDASNYSFSYKHLGKKRKNEDFSAKPSNTILNLDEQKNKCLNKPLCKPPTVITRRSGYGKKTRKIRRPKHFETQFVVTETNICIIHDKRVKYWCETCKGRRCERCVNVVYSKQCINHIVILMEDHVEKEKIQKKDKIKKISQTCMDLLDRSMKVLQVNEEETELKELYRRDQIRQEFVSFHQLLIEEEHKILGKLDSDMKDYRSQNRLTKQNYWKLIEEEARLMCESLNVMEQSDPYGLNLMAVDEIISRDWSNLLSNAKKVGLSVKAIPSRIENTFSLENLKKTAWLDLSNDESDIFSPLKVSDLFSCLASGTQVSDITLQVEILLNRKKVFESRLMLQYYILNVDGKYCLLQNSRYLVKARTVNTPKPQESPWKHILIVTGWS